jgi:hypothetical protein
VNVTGNPSRSGSLPEAGSQWRLALRARLRRFRHAWRRTIALLRQLRAVEVEEPAVGMEDLKWLWTAVRGHAAPYRASGSPRKR